MQNGSKCLDLSVQLEGQITYLQHTKERPGGIETGFPRQSDLAHGHNRPQSHLCWDPSVWSEFLGNELGRNFSEQEGDQENSVSLLSSIVSH
jgi:hypothetical protein